MTTRIFHITDICNLASIVEEGSILSKNSEGLNGLKVVSIAHSSIQARRSEKPILISPFGSVHDYVPFYFAPRSPMLYALHKGNVEGYQKGQSQIIYLVSTAERIAASQLEFVFTNRNASLSNATFFNDFDKFPEEVDQDILQAEIWRNTVDDGDRKARRQAEFLVKDKVPLSEIIEIGVFDSKAKELAEKTFERSWTKITVGVKREWYFDD